MNGTRHTFSIHGQSALEKFLKGEGGASSGGTSAIGRHIAKAHEHLTKMVECCDKAAGRHPTDEDIGLAGAHGSLAMHSLEKAAGLAGGGDEAEMLDGPSGVSSASDALSTNSRITDENWKAAKYRGDDKTAFAKAFAKSFRSPRAYTIGR